MSDTQLTTGDNPEATSVSPTDNPDTSADVGGDQATDTTPADQPDAQSSSASDATLDPTPDPETMEDAIASALDAGNADEEAEPADAEPSTSDDTDPDDKAEAADDAAKTDDNDGTDKDAAEEADPTEEELKGYKPGVQKRIKKLLSQRNEATTKAAALEADATSYQGLRKFMTANSLDDREAADLFQLGADLKSGEPTRMQAFLDKVMPFVNQALVATGKATPEDLQEQVDNGDMTDEAARRFAQERHARQNSDAQLQRASATQEANRTQQATADHQKSVVDSVGAWETQMKASDPDFSRKAEAMYRFGQALVHERGYPKTAKEAVEYSKEAHAQASKHLRPSAPKATRPTPSGASTPRSGMTATATTLEEIIEQGLSG